MSYAKELLYYLERTASAIFYIPCSNEWTNRKYCIRSPFIFDNIVELIHHVETDKVQVRFRFQMIHTLYDAKTLS